MGGLSRIRQPEHLSFYFITGSNRSDLGIPNDWSRTESWLSFREKVKKIAKEVITKKALKNSEIPELDDYEKPQSKEFWSIFPKNYDSSKCKNLKRAIRLKKRLISIKDKISDASFRRGMKTVEYLTNGAPACQIKELPGCMVKNANTSFRNGRIVTDNIATWAKEGVICGPYDCPPFKKFRSNCLMGIEQHDKVRIVLNVSLPESLSFNSNIKEEKMEKVKMSSARLFGFSVKKAGKNAVMSKFDLKDAYKNMPCEEKDHRLQGFRWLDKYFFECTQIFGARTAVANFDIMGNTLKTIALQSCSIPSDLVHRQLDDVPVVGPCSKDWCQEFTKSYEKTCAEMLISIAPDCPKMEKAFKNSTYGKVLGINFDTKNLCWNLPYEKRERAISAICDALDSETSLLQMQKLMGRLNDISLMCPFLQGFKKPLLNDLKRTHSSDKPIILSEQSKKDLLVWAGMLLDKNEWIPIPSEPCAETVAHKTFTSDAAGEAAGCTDCNTPGAASIGFDEDGIFIMAKRIIWPQGMMNKKDSKGVRLGDKSTTLEIIGVLLPLLLIPEKLKNQHLVFKVDNIACIYGWENRAMKGDIMASIIVRAIHLISCYLGSTIHMYHLPRKSDFESNMVDRMTREKTLSFQDRKLLNSFRNLKIPSFFMDWLSYPTEDWDLSMKILNHVKDLVQ